MKQIPFIFVAIFILIGCVHKSEKNTILSNINEKPNGFIGEWESFERIYPYVSNLIIKNDSTFYYESGACLFRGFSKGRWKINNDTLILNSSNLDSCLYLSYFDEDCILITEGDTSKFIRETTISGCIPFYETEYILFKNDAFYIYNDTLIHKTKNSKQCIESRNIFFRIVVDTNANHP